MRIGSTGAPGLTSHWGRCLRLARGNEETMKVMLKVERPNASLCGDVRGGGPNQEPFAARGVACLAGINRSSQPPTEISKRPSRLTTALRRKGGPAPSCDRRICRIVALDHTPVRHPG